MHVVEVLQPDAIPSIDQPSFTSEYRGDPDDRVIVLETTPPRAYPLRILHYHEIVNDDLGAADEPDPVAVTWCPLCGSAVVYERRVEDRTLTFGVSGKLADDDLVMYDRETGSEWKQSLGVCIAGSLEGTQLTARPAGVLTWAAFREAHPDGVVLEPPHLDSEAASDDDDPAPVDYAKDPYADYFEGEGFGLGSRREDARSRPWEREDIGPKAVVLGLVSGEDALGFPVPVVRAADGIVRAAVGETDVVVLEGEDEPHAYADPGFDLRWEDGELVGDGTQWDPSTGRAADGRQLERLPARRVFAFNWQDDHGPDAFYGL